MYCDREGDILFAKFMEFYFVTFSNQDQTPACT